MASQWAGGGAIPPPPGVEPNFADPPSQVNSNIALHAICLSVVTVLLPMRLYTRVSLVRANLGLDDYLLLLSYGLTVAFSALMLKSGSLGIGRHMWDTPAEWLVDALKWFSIATYIYLLLGASIKLSVLFFYYRIFSMTNYILVFVIILVGGLHVGIFFATVFGCNPVAKQWNQMLDGTCFNPEILPYLSGATSSLTDIFVLVFPLPLLWNLKMDAKKRARVIAVFGLGVFACVASLVRLGMTPILSSSFDATWNIATISIWATLEVNVGITCACLMLLPAFLQHHLPESFKASLSRLLPSSKKSSGHSWRRSQGPIWPGYTHQLSSTEAQHSLVELKPEAQGHVLEAQRVVAGNDPESRPYHYAHSRGSGTAASELRSKH